MITLKPLSKDGITGALKKAHRYRLLNEPVEAESICLDILQVDENNPQALTTMLLAVTDQFARGTASEVKRAHELVPRFESEYEQMYYSGIICERYAKAILASNIPGCKFEAHDKFRDAMDYYEKAEAVQSPGNDDAILRWNTCARVIDRRKLEPRQEDDFSPYGDD